MCISFAKKLSQIINTTIKIYLSGTEFTIIGNKVTYPVLLLLKTYIYFLDADYIYKFNKEHICITN